MLAPVVPESLWTVDEPFRMLGLPLGARMTVLRLGSGGLWVHAPLSVDEATAREIETLGPVRAIVAPSRFHFKDVSAFRARFPEAVAHGSRDLVRQRPQLAFHHTLGDEPDPAWAGEMEQVVVRGHPMMDEVVFFHRPTRTLIVTDLLMSTHADAPLSGRLFGRLVGIYERPGPPLEMRLTFRDRKAARATMERILEWDFDRLILSHGRVVPTGARAVFERAYAFLLTG